MTIGEQFRDEEHRRRVDALTFVASVLLDSGGTAKLDAIVDRFEEQCEARGMSRLERRRATEEFQRHGAMYAAVRWLTCKCEGLGEMSPRLDALTLSRVGVDYCRKLMAGEAVKMPPEAWR